MLEKTLLIVGLRLTIIAIAVCFSYSAFAQPDPPEDPIPVDGGISILLGAGVAYGIKKIHDARKK